MFFGKKKKANVSVGEIRKMSSSGVSDRDIIKRLKKEGYSYDEIERAMLEAVKEGVGEEEKPAREPRRREEEVYEPPAEHEERARAEPPLFEGLEETAMEPLTDFSEELPKPEVVIEELVEGVVEDKWKKFDDKIDKFNREFDNVRGELKQFEQKLRAARENEDMKEVDIEVREINNRLDELDARIGGLEKAFKQILPSMTRNIENLSQMIHELKGEKI